MAAAAFDEAGQGLLSPKVAATGGPHIAGRRWNAAAASIAERLYKLNQTAFNTAATASLASLYVGYCVAISGSAFLYFERTSTTQVLKKEYFLTALQVSAAVGALVCSFLADVIGRRSSLVIASSLGIFGAVWASTAASSLPLLLSQLASGLAVGFCLVACPLFIAETAPKAPRGMLLSLPELALSLGLALASLASFLCAANWRRMLGLGVVPAVALGAASLLLLPESPRWLAQVGRVQEAAQSLALLEEREQAAALSLEEVLAATGHTDDSLQGSELSCARRQQGRGGWLSGLALGAQRAVAASRDLLFRSNKALLGILVMCLGASFYQQVRVGLTRLGTSPGMMPGASEQAGWTIPAVVSSFIFSSRRLETAQSGIQATGMDATISFLPELFAVAGVSSTAAEFAATLGVAASRAAAAVLSGALVDEFGRKPLLIISAAGATLALFSQAVVLHVLSLGQNLADDTEESLGAFSVQRRQVGAAVFAIIAMCNFSAFFSIGLGPVVPIVQTESCPQRFRAPALGAAVAVGRLTSALLVSSLVSFADKTSASAPFFVFGLVSLASAFFFSIGVKESRGLSIEEASRQPGTAYAEALLEECQPGMSAPAISRRGPARAVELGDVAPL